MASRKRAKPDQVSSTSASSKGAPRSIDRREFVRSAGSLLAVSAIAGACTETALNGTGTIRLYVNGLLPGASSAGVVTISGGSLAEPVAVVLAPSALREEVVEVGTYSVEYQPPAGYTIATGTEVVSEVDVQANTVTDVLLSLQPATGSIRITVTGHALTAANAGTAQVRRTDIAGQAAVSATVPVGGVVTIPVAAGTHEVVHVPPSGHQAVSGQGGPQTVIISSGGTGDAVFTVETVAVPTGTLFHSDWSTGLGTGNAAILDTNRANPWNFRGAGCEVVSAAGLGFPTVNCLRVGWSNRLFNFVRKSGLPPVAIGQTRYYRWYERVVWPNNTSDNQVHPHQDGFSGGAHNWMLLYFNGNNNYTVQLWGGDNNAYPNKRYICNVPLNKNQTYRFEIALSRTDQTRHKLQARIYDANNNLVAGNTNFVREDSNGSVTLANMADLTFYNLANTDGFNMGCNDAGPEAGDFAYQAAVAISDSDWIGPYAGGV